MTTGGGTTLLRVTPDTRDTRVATLLLATARDPGPGRQAPTREIGGAGESTTGQGVESMKDPGTELTLRSCLTV